MILKLLNDKSIKGKEKTELISSLLSEGKVSPEELISIASALKKDAERGTCIEAIEYVTQKNPEVASVKVLEFVTKSLADKAPRLKWESARVIGNIAHLYPNKLENTICNLLKNTEDSGTVVRWSAAFALSQIYLLKTKHNKELKGIFESIIAKDEKNSIKKIYLTALKKVK